MRYSRADEFMAVLLKEFRVEALGHAASGVLTDPEVAGKWLELFELHDPPFAAKLKTLLSATTQDVFAELSRELFPGEVARRYEPVGPGRFA